MLERMVSLFPVWAILFSLSAYVAPGLWTPFKPYIVYLLGAVMFGMGLTITPRDFAEVGRRPWHVSLGTALQFLIMPLCGWLVGRSLGLPAPLFAGLVLVGCCPGGTASNVVCYLAKGDVALSITLTAVSTLLAVIATPFLTWLYVGQTIAVPVGEMIVDIVKIVLVPVVFGVAINHFGHRGLVRFERFFPLVSVFAIVAIIAIIVAMQRDRLQELGPAAALAVVLHNTSGLALGYGFAKLLGCDRRVCRTIAIEVGMQNSGLGVALAVKYFTAAAALPGAIFSIWHNLSGSILAGYWAGKPAER